MTVFGGWELLIALEQQRQSWRDPDVVTGVEFALGELGASELHHFQRSAASLLWASLCPSV